MSSLIMKCNFFFRWLDDNDPDADWFCWQCECIDDCLGMVNEQSETDTRAWEDLFPELRSNADTGLLG